MLRKMKLLRKGARVAILGAGFMGKGVFYQCHVTPGINCVAIADIKIDKAVGCAESMKLDYRVTHDLKTVRDTLCRGLVAVCEDGDLLARCELVDVLVDSSNSIRAAAKFAVTALEHQKHLVLMNTEVDLTFGPYLMDLAEKKGVVYTSCGGDQHTVLKRLIDDVRLWGFELVMAGNIKGFLDRYANPTTIIPEADKRNLDYKMCTSLTDGTKLNIEMAVLANGLNLSALVFGMQGPRARHVRDVFHLFDFPALWRQKQPWVDYVVGAEPSGGVFIIGFCDNEYQKTMLRYYKMGDGPFYLFYRCYHLCHIEAMACIAEAFLDGRSLLKPDFGFRTNVYAYAKRDLCKGEELDGIGGYTCYGLIENCKPKGLDLGLPICLAENVKLKRAVKKNEKISMKDVDYDSSNFEFELYFKAVECSNKGEV